MPAGAPCLDVATSDTSSAVMAKKRASLIVSPLTPAPPTTAPPPDLPSDMGRRGSFYAASPAADLQADVSRRTTFYERKFQVRNVWPRRRPPRTFNATSLQKERQREADELRHAEQVKEQAASLEKAITADANALAAKQARLEETAEQVRVQSAAVDSRASVLNADRARLDVEMAHAREETEKVACVGRPASWPSLTGRLAPDPNAGDAPVQIGGRAAAAGDSRPEHGGVPGAPGRRPRPQTGTGSSRVAPACMPFGSTVIPWCGPQLEARAHDLDEKEAALQAGLSKIATVASDSKDLTRREEAFAAERAAFETLVKAHADRERELVAQKDALDEGAAEHARSKQLFQIESVLSWARVCAPAAGCVMNAGWQEAQEQRVKEMATLRRTLLAREGEVAAGHLRVELAERRIAEREAQLDEREAVVRAEKATVERERSAAQADAKTAALDKSKARADLAAAQEARAQVQALSGETDAQLSALQRRETALHDKESEVETLLLRLKTREGDVAGLGKRLELERVELEKRRQVRGAPVASRLR